MIIRLSMHPLSFLVSVFKRLKLIGLIAYLFLGAGNTLLGQNLVPNPSFEHIDSLPTLNGATDFNGNVHDWHRGAAWWPELCHVNANPVSQYGQFGWPNPINIQMPRTGLAHALIMNMEWRGYQGWQHKRSYLAVPLKAKIPAQTKVYAEFYVSAHEFLEKDFYTNNLGLWLSKDSIYDQGNELILVTPQINVDTIMNDTLNWVKVGGSFIAESELGYLAIGNFFSNANTLYYMDPLSDPNEFRSAWYYIDDVKVRILNPQIPDTVRVCKGDIAESIAIGEENHQWAFAHSPGQIEGTDSIFTYYPDSSQTVFFYGSFDTLTTYVWVDDLTVHLGADTVICAGDDFWLQGPASADSHLWSTGSTAAQVPITQTGTYWLQSTKGMCTKTDSIFVDVVDLANLAIQSPPVACLGDEMTLWVKPQPYATYLWSTGQTDTAITITEDGQYSVTVTNPCGTATASKEVVFEKCVCHFYLPNAFSPNGDGVNDEFYPVFDCSIRNYHMWIADRWGNVVFDTTNPDERWQGQNAQPGVYSVHVFYQGLNEEGQTVGDDLVQTLTIID